MTTTPEPSPAPNHVLRTWRETHHLTRAQMADALNNTPTAQHGYITLRCGPTLIAKWETGHIRWPSTRYQHALHDLTGHHPTDLGFTRPGFPATAITPTPPQPSPPPAVSDLTALAAELTTRGYTTHLTIPDPYLTITHPLGGEPERIYAGPENYTWGDCCGHTPIEAWRHDTPTQAADAVDELMDTIRTYPGDDTTGTP
jgi:hypothetical protein